MLFLLLLVLATVCMHFAPELAARAELDPQNVQALVFGTLFGVGVSYVIHLTDGWFEATRRRF